ncbi:MAG: DUF2252 domain-containing protein [Hyphomicrobiales bacterium]
MQKISAHETHGGDEGSQHRSTATRRAEGKALRDSVPRLSHGHWKRPKSRPDPIDLLDASNEGRLPQLIPIRYGRMLQSPFAFYRGSAAIMASDLSHTPVTGHRVQACGDAHLMNFGGFATPERLQIFDINDLDETLPAPWEWDLKRLAASVIIAGRHIDLPESLAVRAAHGCVQSYREHMTNYSTMRVIDVWYDKIDLEKLLAQAPDEKVRRRAERRFEEARGRSVPDDDFPKLAEHRGATPRIKDDPPLIFHPTGETQAEYDARIAEALASYRTSLPEHVRVLFDRFHCCDVAVKVVGIGSVGTMCLIGLFMAGDDDPLFLQFKQARASVLEPYAGKSLHKNHGERVVAGQRLMQSASDIFLGWTMGSKSGRHFYVRQLRDMKLSAIIEGFDGPTLKTYAEACAWALARAHARSGDAALISGYIGSSEELDEAICEFAVDYADQNELDHAAFVKAARSGKIKVQLDA